MITEYVSQYPKIEQGNVILFFYSDISLECSKLQIELKKYKLKLPITLLFVDVCEHDVLMTAYDVTIVPLLIFLKNTEKVYVKEGLISVEEFEKLVLSVYYEG